MRPCRMRRALALSASLAVLASLAPSTAGAIEYVNDPLTDPSFPGRGSKGGSFSADGWTTADEPDSFWYEIPDALPSGRVDYTVQGLSVGGTLSGTDHDI